MEFTVVHIESEVAKAAHAEREAEYRRLEDEGLAELARAKRDLDREVARRLARAVLFGEDEG